MNAQRIQQGSFAAILDEVAVERDRQIQLWGIQDHPSLAPQVLSAQDDDYRAAVFARYYRIATAGVARRACDDAFAAKRGTYAHVLIEEVAEVIDCLDDEIAMRAELIQVAAVAAAWVETIDRRRAKPHPPQQAVLP